MNTLRRNIIIAALLLYGITGIQAQTTNNLEETFVAYEIAGMNDVIAKKDIPYLKTSDTALNMDIYYPPKFDFKRNISAIIFITGIPDTSMVKLTGNQFRKYGQYTSWCKIVAASGMAAIVYETIDPKNNLISLIEYIKSEHTNLSINDNSIGAFVCSGNTPTGVSYILSSSSIFSCAVLYYGFFLSEDVENLAAIESMFKQMGFQKPPILPDSNNWKSDVPLLIVRSGQDNIPNLNQSMQNFLDKAIKQNLPITLINYSEGLHGFEIYNDNETTRQIIKNTLAFFNYYLKQ